MATGGLRIYVALLLGVLVGVEGFSPRLAHPSSLPALWERNSMRCKAGEDHNLDTMTVREHRYRRTVDRGAALVTAAGVLMTLTVPEAALALGRKGRKEVYGIETSASKAVEAEAARVEELKAKIEGTDKDAKADPFADLRKTKKKKKPSYCEVNRCGY